mgnify:CR=1 FL=1
MRLGAERARDGGANLLSAGTDVHRHHHFAVGEIANIAGLVDSGDAVIVDGSTGDVHVRPASDIEVAYSDRVKLRARRQGTHERGQQKE